MKKKKRNHTNLMGVNQNVIKRSSVSEVFYDDTKMKVKKIIQLKNLKNINKIIEGNDKE